jgi:mannonate dehydratase
MPPSAATSAVFRHAFTFASGYLHPGDVPGLGVELDESAAASYPYQQAYLPYARLQDGTMHDW